MLCINCWHLIEHLQDVAEEASEKSASQLRMAGRGEAASAAARRDPAAAAAVGRGEGLRGAPRAAAAAAQGRLPCGSSHLLHQFKAIVFAPDLQNVHKRFKTMTEHLE